MYSRPHIFHIPSLLFVHMSPCRVRVPPLMKALDRLKSLLNECLLVHLHSNSSLFCPHTQSCQCQGTLQHNNPLWIHMSRQTVHAYCWVVTLNYCSQFSLQRGYILAQRTLQSQGRSLSQTAQTFRRGFMMKCVLQRVCRTIYTLWTILL